MQDAWETESDQILSQGSRHSMTCASMGVCSASWETQRYDGQCGGKLGTSWKRKHDTQLRTCFWRRKEWSEGSKSQLCHLPAVGPWGRPAPLFSHLKTGDHNPRLPGEHSVFILSVPSWWWITGWKGHSQSARDRPLDSKCWIRWLRSSLLPGLW